MDYCSGLENRRSVAIRGRGFESHTFLQLHTTRCHMIPVLLSATINQQDVTQTGATLALTTSCNFSYEEIDHD